MLALVSLAVGCGGATYSRGVVRGTPSYRIDPPSADFRRVTVDGDNDLAFVSDETAALLQVNGSCDPGLDIPLTALTNHLLVGFTERSYVGEPALTPLDGREALTTHVVAKLDGVPRELLLVVSKKDGCVYDFAAIASPGPAFESARAELERMLASFSTDRRR